MRLPMPPLPSDSFCFSCCKFFLLQWKDIIKLVMLPLHSCIVDIVELLLKIGPHFYAVFQYYSSMFMFIRAQCII